MSIEKEMVRKGYNKIAEMYYAHRDLTKFNSELKRFSELLPEDAHVLDVGCGAGVPTAQYLTNNSIKVTGIDISDTMLELARENVPHATFRKMDAYELDFPPESFDGLISVYTLFHIQRKHHAKILHNFYEVLRPRGILMINSGVSESEGTSDFFGVPMFWSNFTPDTLLKLAKDTGFSIIFEGVLQRGGEYQYWIFARKELKK